MVEARKQTKVDAKRAKVDAKRAAVLQKLADFVLSEGLAAASLRNLAQAADTSDRMLLYYFPDKNAILAATLEVISGRMVEILSGRAVSKPKPPEKLQPAILKVALDDEVWPFMRMWLEIAAFAAGGDPFYKAVGEQIGRGFLEWTAMQVDAPTKRERDKAAARLLVLTEGLILLKSIGLDETCRKAL